MRHRLSIICIAALMTTLSACGGDDETPPATGSDPAGPVTDPGGGSGTPPVTPPADDGSSGGGDSGGPSNADPGPGFAIDANANSIIPRNGGTPVHLTSQGARAGSAGCLNSGLYTLDDPTSSGYKVTTVMTTDDTNAGIGRVKSDTFYPGEAQAAVAGRLVRANTTVSDSTGFSDANANGTTSITNYQELADDVLTLYGTSTAGAPVIAYGDPKENFFYVMSAGEEIPDFAYFETPEIGRINMSTLQRYLGRATISVPAGTFETCHFQETLTEFSITTDYWLAVGSGVPVRVSNNSNLLNQVLVSATINNVPVRP